MMSICELPIVEIDRLRGRMQPVWFGMLSNPVPQGSGRGKVAVRQHSKQ